MTSKPISDAEFDRHLETYAQVIERTLADKNEDTWLTTVVLICQENVDLLGLVPGKGARKDTSLYDVLFEYGREIGGTRPVPSCVFVSVLCEREDGTDFILVSGSTPDGRLNAARLELTRNRRRHFKLTQTHLYKLNDGMKSEGRTHSGEFVRGFLETSKLS